MNKLSCLYNDSTVHYNEANSAEFSIYFTGRQLKLLFHILFDDNISRNENILTRNDVLFLHDVTNALCDVDLKCNSLFIPNVMNHVQQRPSLIPRQW